MKNTFKMMLVAFAMFAFSANAGAMTLNLNKVAKSLIVDQDGNGGVKVKNLAIKTARKKNVAKMVRKNLAAKKTVKKPTKRVQQRCKKKSC